MPVFANERLIAIISSRDVIQAAILKRNRGIDGLPDVSRSLFIQGHAT